MEDFELELKSAREKEELEMLMTYLCSLSPNERNEEEEFLYRTLLLIDMSEKQLTHYGI